jgi:hypothetical protein
VLDIHLERKGVGIDEQASDRHGNALAVDRRYFRPAEVETLLGDATKARKQLGWAPRIDFRSLVEEIALEDLKTAERDALVARRGYWKCSAYESQPRWVSFPTRQDNSDGYATHFSNGCPPGIRTPICCSRGSCPTIERGGNAANTEPADATDLFIVKGGFTLVNSRLPGC